MANLTSSSLAKANSGNQDIAQRLRDSQLSIQQQNENRRMSVTDKFSLMFLNQINDALDQAGKQEEEEIFRMAHDLGIDETEFSDFDEDGPDDAPALALAK